MISKTVEVKIHLENDASEATGYRLVNLTIGDEPPITLTDDKPAPRRLRQALVRAARDAS